MPDNVTFQTATPATPPDGTVIATDQVVDPTLGTVQVQFVKLMDGTLDGATKAAVGALGLKVDVGRNVLVQASKTRPADAAPYTANDAIAESTTVGTVWQFSNVARAAGGSGTIVGARLETDQVANLATYRLYLYSAAPTAINDNAECTYLIANSASYLGAIDFPALVKDSANSTAAKVELAGALLPFVCGAAAHLYGLLSTPSGFTPASGQLVTVTLVVAQD